MKSLKFLFTLTLSALLLGTASAQVANGSNGNVGIHWSGNNFPSRLSIYDEGNGDPWNSGITLLRGNGGDYWARIVTGPEGFLFKNFTETNTAFSFRNHADQKWLTILNNGNIGIDNINPSFRLDVNGAGRFGYTANASSCMLNESGAAFALTGGGWIGSYGAPADKFPLRLFESYGWNYTLQDIKNQNGAYSGFRIKSAGATSWDNGTLFQVRADGNVGIGTENPIEKLTVNGSILAMEVKVEPGPWPDYVFAKEYKRLSLNDLQKYIEANKHLPEVPSAAEVEKDGISLGKMNAKLLQKIEELTLYVIEQHKKIEQQDKRLEEQAEQVRKLQAKIEVIIIK